MKTAKRGHLLATVILLLTFAGSSTAADSKACAQCHSEVYKNYVQSPMATSSGLVSPASAPLSGKADFSTAFGAHVAILQKPDGTHVRVTQGGTEFERRLDLFIGAGIMGRSYAYFSDGYLFQAPASFYQSSNQWDLSPGFEAGDKLIVSRPVEPACLGCHASRLNNDPATLNSYRSPPFAEPGISCERCHGSGDSHMAQMRAGSLHKGSLIVNPAKLAAPERDSICAQCHLVGAVRVAKATNQYKPGTKLFDSTAAFLWSSGAHNYSANSHFEQLVQSKCWRGSLGKLWCGTCHDPHNEVSAGRTANYYRGRCLTCHRQRAMACSADQKSRQAVQDNCVSCHMPSRPLGTVQHAAQVDHTISRNPHKAEASSIPEDAELLPFPGSEAADRELGLAYASEAIAKGNRNWGLQAFRLLQAVNAKVPGDALVADQLGQLNDLMHHEREACELFATVVNSTQVMPGAMVNLGICQANGGDLKAAIASWTRAVQQNPGLETARLNLAVAQFRSGDRASAEQTIKETLKFDPFSAKARQLLESLRSGQ